MGNPALRGDALAHIARCGARIECAALEFASLAGCASLLGLGAQDHEPLLLVALTLLDAAVREDRLTPAQHAVASLVCLGANNHLISDLRKTSPRTVGGQLTEIFKSAGVVDGRAEYTACILRRVLWAVAHQRAQLEQHVSTVGARQNGARPAR